MLLSRGSSPLALSFVARGTCLLLAVGLHGAAFAVTSHGASLVPSESRSASDPVIDVVPEPDPAAPESLGLREDERTSTNLLTGARAPASPLRRLASPAPSPRDAARRESSPPRDIPPSQTLRTPEAPAALEAVASALGAPRFAMALSNRPPIAIAQRPTSDPGTGSVELGSDAAPLAEEAVSSPARLLGSVSPPYPEGARAQEVEADIVVAIVVTKTGSVSDARVVKRAGMGLDEAVLSAIRAARFVPAMRGGRSVAVRMRWTVSFRLR